MSDATWVSSRVRNTRSKPALTAARTPRLRRELFLDALEDQHVRVDAHADREDEAGDAGQRHHRPKYAMNPSRITRLTTTLTMALMPDSL